MVSLKKLKSGEIVVIATESIPINREILTWSHGYITPFRNKYSIELGENKHLMHPEGMYLMHSFKPNCKVDLFGLHSIKPLEPGDILTFDYTLTESEFAEPFIDAETGIKLG